MRAVLGLLASVLGLAALAVRPAKSSIQTMGNNIMTTPLELWSPPSSADPYLSDIDAAEATYNIPHHLLARLLYQESHFRADIINGSTLSGAGAVGIAQIVPYWHPGVDATNPQASIWYAAKYLSALHRQFGSWPLALAAYNWGPGNLKKNPNPSEWPQETQDYVSQITADVPIPA